ncbi:hypothetical protein ACHQM5_003141 [Ranunculus cassubicifolius]
MTSTFFTYTSPSIPCFEGENLDHWVIQRRPIFISNDLLEIVEDGYDENDTTSTNNLKELEKKNAKALQFIHAGCISQGSRKVISIKLQSAWRDFDNLDLKENENIQKFGSRVAEVVNQIQIYGDTIQDKRIVKKMLRSLPHEFDHVAATIEESKDLSKLSFHELMGSLEAHEFRMSRSSNPPLEQAFQSKLSIDGGKKEDHGQRSNFQRKNQF